MTGRRAAALKLLDELQASAVRHLGSDLLTHLIATESLLSRWGAPQDVALAGLCHAFYGTDGFAVSLLDLEERHRLVEVIGERAELLVYRYAACDRAVVYPQLGMVPLSFTDRFTGRSEPLDGTDLEGFALLTAANELDLVIRDVFDAATRTAVVALVERLRPYAPKAIAAALREISP